MIHRLLTGYNTANRISNIINSLSEMNQAEKDQNVNDIIKNHVGYAASAGLIPIPGADLAAVTAVQLNMLRQLAKQYDVKFMESIGKTIITAVGGSSIARIAASLVKIIPGVGTVVGEMSMAAMSAATTFALGKMFTRHFDNGGNFENFDIRSSKKVYEEELKNGKKVVDTEGVAKNNNTDDLVTQLKKLSDLKEAGVLSEAEFQQMKSKLLDKF